MPLGVGIDVGTSGVNALAIDENGEVLARREVVARYRAMYPAIAAADRGGPR